MIEPVRMEVTSDTANIAVVRAEVTSIAERLGFSEEEISGLALAIGEAMANIIKHGYEGRCDQPIEIVIESLRDDPGIGLQITMRDCGRQVDPDTIIGRDLDAVRPGGLGTHIMKTVMDVVEYSPCQGAGMQLRLIKWRHHQSEAGSEGTASENHKNAGDTREESESDG